MQTRNFIILLILIPLLLIAGAALYFLGPWGGAKDEEHVAKSRTQVLVSQPVISPVLSFDGEKVWYMASSGKLFRVNIESGQEEEYLLSEALPSPVRVIWPKSGNDFIVELPPSPSRGQFALYDAASKKFHFFPPALQGPAFLADPTKIIYEWVRGDGGRELKVSDKNGENFHKIADLKRPDYEIAASPAKEEVVLFGRDNLEPSFLILVNLATGEFQDIDQKDFYRSAKFSGDGSNLAVLKNSELMIYDLNSPSKPPLKVRGEQGAGPPIEEFIWSPGGKSVVYATNLGFFKYDLTVNQQSELYRFKEGENYEPFELILDATESFLLIVDEKTKYLHKLNF